MANVTELRNHQRYGGHSLVAQIGETEVEVFNISLAGVKVARPDDWRATRNLDFHIIPKVAGVVEKRHAVPVHGHVVGDGDDHLRIAFSTISHTLANVVGTHLADDVHEKAQIAGR